MAKPNETYVRFAPLNLWYSAREEVLFGGGQYRMALTDEKEAKLLHRRWTDFLITHPQGMAFVPILADNKLLIELSMFGLGILAHLGVEQSDLQITGMNTELKKQFLEQFEAACKELS